MLSVVIPTCNSEEGLARTLASLVPAAAEGIVREVMVVDAGSSDGTPLVAEAAGCLLVPYAGTWGARVRQGIESMRRAPWLLLLPPHVILEGEWFRELAAFIERIERANRGDTVVASFRLAYDEFGLHARIAERAIALSSGIFGLPAPEQGLILSRRLWDRVKLSGPIDTHAALIGRIGRRRLHILRANAVVISGGAKSGGVPTGPALAGHALAALGVPGMSLGSRQA